MPMSPGGMEASEVPNIMGEECAPVVDGRLQLFLIGHAEATDANGADYIESPVEEHFCQQGADVLVQVELYRCHAVSVCSRIRRSRSERWS